MNFGVPLDGRTIVRGTMMNMFQSILTGALLMIVATPIIFHRLGPDGFGLWTLMWTAASWFFFLDVGISAGVTKFSGHAGGAADRGAFQKLFCTTCYLYAGLSFIVAFLSALAVHPLLAVFVGGHAHPADDFVLGLLCFFYFSLGGLKSVSGLLAGLQQIESAGKIAIAMGFLQIAAIWIWSRWCGTMTGLAVIYLGCALVQILILIWQLGRVSVSDAPSADVSDIGRVSVSDAPSAGVSDAGRVRIGLDRFPFSLRVCDIDFSLLREMVRFSGVVYLTQVLVNLLVSDRLYLGWIRAPLNQVAEYHLGALLVGKMVAVLSTLSIAVFPAAAAFEARQDTRRIELMTHRMFRVYAAGGFFLFMFLCFYVDEIFKVWLNQEIPFAVQITWLLAGWGLTAIWGGLRAVAAAIGRPKIELQSTLLAVLGMMVLYPVLIRPFGPRGLAASLSIVFLFSNAIFVCRFRRTVVPLSVSTLLGDGFVKPLLCAAVAVIPLSLFLDRLGVIGRGGTALILFGGFAASLHIYIVAARLAGLIRSEDLEIFKRR